MIEIAYPSTSEKVDEISQMLANNSIAYKLTENKDLSTIRLVNGRTKIEGETEVMNFILQLVEETSQWWFCQCGG